MKNHTKNNPPFQKYNIFKTVVCAIFVFGIPMFSGFRNASKLALVSVLDTVRIYVFEYEPCP